MSDFQHPRVRVSALLGLRHYQHIGGAGAEMMNMYNDFNKL